MAFAIFTLCVSCQGAQLSHFGWGALLFGCINLFSLVAINSIYKKFKAEYNVYRSKLDLYRRTLLESIDRDVDSAISFQNEII